MSRRAWQREAPKESWSGRLGFILAATGSAVGLGSICKFPYEIGVNGGAAFVLFYVAGLVLAVVPLMLAEFAMGRAPGRARRGAAALRAQVGDAGADRRGRGRTVFLPVNQPISIEKSGARRISGNVAGQCPSAS